MRPDSILFTALHGELALQPGQDPHLAASDAYSLFVARSAAMGWLAEAAEDASGGIWGMNDAGQDSGCGSQPKRIAWFQVSLIEPIAADRPLPVQALLSCAGDVVARIGTPRLDAARLLLPVQSLAGSAASSRVSAVMTLLQGAGWFVDCDRQSRTGVDVTLDGGQDPILRSAAPEMLAWIRGLAQDVFWCDSLTDEVVVLEPAVSDELWLGPVYHRAATFRGSLAEWSVDALGWLAALLAEASFRHGVTTSLMLTARRSSDSASRM